MDIKEVLPVAKLADLPPGGLLSVAFDGVQVLLAHVEGEIHAVRDECSHEAAKLSDGELMGDTVECPWHFSRFCLRTGTALDFPAVDPVDTYEVRVEDGQIFLSVPGAAGDTAR